MKIGNSSNMGKQPAKGINIATARHRIDAVLIIQLLHFLLHARGIVGEFRLNLLHQRLNLLHLIRRLRLLVHEGRNYQSEDDGHDDDGQAPVLAEAEEELDNVKYPVLEYFPHTMDFLPLVDKSRRLRSWPITGQDRNRAALQVDTVEYVLPSALSLLRSRSAETQ